MYRSYVVKWTLFNNQLRNWRESQKEERQNKVEESQLSVIAEAKKTNKQKEYLQIGSWRSKHNHPTSQDT